MVLHKSKWDKKATYLYLKKHGIPTRPVKPDDTPRPKWSGKRKDTVALRVVLQDSDDEWDSDTDTAFINHFYPQIGEAELTTEQKQKIKAQIIALLENEDTQDAPLEPLVIDGIYLGTEPAQNELEVVSTDKKFDLAQFLTENKPKRRTLLKPKLLENIYDEYGIDSDSIARVDRTDTAFKPKQVQRTLADITAAELDGFHIGEMLLSDLNKPKDYQENIRILTKEEAAVEADRKEKADREALFRDMKRKLAAKSKGISTQASKVLELDNYNDADIGKLNSKIARGAIASQPQKSSLDFDNDLDALLGSTVTEKSDLGNVDIDDLLSRAPSTHAPVCVNSPSPKPQYARNTSHDAFLDDLLG